ncbi:MAG: sulfurtransferase TusA family protein [Candidatus Jordarchaeales archaeon]
MVKEEGEVVARRLDVRGEVCPIPLIKVRDSLKNMAPGEVLEVICDSPPSKKNLQRFVEKEGHEIVKLVEEGAVFRMYIRKKV